MKLTAEQVMERRRADDRCTAVHPGTRFCCTLTLEEHKKMGEHMSMSGVFCCWRWKGEFQ